MSEFGTFLLNFAFNFLVALLVVRFIYYPSTHNKHYVFTFLAFNTVIYFVLYFMTSIEIGIGVGFGLFAIFSILRYRTDPMPIREMTYLFIIAALPVMNSVGLRMARSGRSSSLPTWRSWSILWVLEKEWGFHYEASRRIVYEKIELIRPDRRAELLADLEDARLGVKVKQVIIGKVNFMRDTAHLTVYYDDPGRKGRLQSAESELVVLAKGDRDWPPYSRRERVRVGPLPHFRAWKMGEAGRGRKLHPLISANFN